MMHAENPASNHARCRRLPYYAFAPFIIALTAAAATCAAAAEQPTKTLPNSPAKRDSIPDIIMKNITGQPQLSFFPAGTIMHIGAFGRISCKIDLENLTDSCFAAAQAMDVSLRTKMDANSWAATYYNDSPYLRRFYEAAASRLWHACSTLTTWNNDVNFFEMDGGNRRNTRSPVFAKSVNKNLEHLALKKFATSTEAQQPEDTTLAPAANDTSPASRPERGIVTTGLAIIGGATLLWRLASLLLGSTEPTWQTHVIQDHANSAIHHNTLAIKDIIASVDEIYHHDHFELRINSVVDHANAITNKVLQVQEALALLQQGHISPLFINPLDLQNAIEVLVQKAYDFHMKLAVESAADALLLPAFGVFDNSTLTIVLPVPAYLIKMNMFQYSGTPLLVRDEEELRLLTPRPLQNMIAVAPKSPQHMVLTQEDLRDCFEVHDNYMCAEQPLLLDREDTCLGALFTANADAIHSHCAFEPHHRTWHIARAGKGAHILTTAKSLTATTTCPDKYSTAVPISQGVFLFRVPPGCTTQTESFSIDTPYEDFATVSMTKSLQWSMEAPVFWTKEGSTSQLQKALNHAAQAGKDLQSAEKLLKQASQTPWWVNLIWFIILLLCVALLTACFVKRYRTATAQLRAFVAGDAVYQQGQQQGNPMQQQPLLQRAAAAAFAAPGHVKLSL